MVVRKRIRHLMWKIFGQPDLPPRTFKLNSKINKYTKKNYTPRYYVMAKMYLDGVGVYSIAINYNITRERVRQCLWKAYRENEMNNDT